MKLIMVPHWVEQALDRESLSLNAVLDPEKLLSTLSREDVAFYCWLNLNLNRWVPTEVMETFSEVELLRSIDTLSADEVDFDISQFNDNLRALNISESNRVNSNVPMNSCELLGALAPKVQPNQISFGIRLINKDTVVLTPKETKSTSLMGMVNELLFCLNTRKAFHDVAKTPLFHYFVSQV